MAEKSGNVKTPTTRLTSLGRPRDLHLSVTNTAKPKKVFTPNLNAVRNKGKAAPTNASDGSHKKNNKRGPKEFRKRDSEASRFVQSTGIFSEGAADIKRDTRYASRGSDAHEGGGEPGGGMEKPKINTAAGWDVDLQEEAKVVTNLLDNCENLQEDAEYDEYQPVVLPLKKNQDNFFKTFAPQVEPDVKIKSEVVKDTHMEDVIEDMSQCSFNQANSYSNTNVAFSLVKLPDTMPGRGFDEEGKPIDYTLDQMSEGQIGKIIKRRSGKMQMVIGNMTYDLSSVEGAPFTEELMAMPDTSSTEPATMTSLSAINERYVISPAWHNLLSQTRDT